MSIKAGFLLSVLITITGALVLLQGAVFRWPGNQQGYAPVQPISFSHKIHAGDNRIPCLYCHSAAEKSGVAGIPAASTCMNCHSQVLKDSPEIKEIALALAHDRPIEWVRVHNLPRHVTFDHSRHVVAGIGCRQCHGPVETMTRVEQSETLSMGMCLSCHRSHREVTLDEAGKPVIAREAAPKRLMASTDCVVCHH